MISTITASKKEYIEMRTKSDWQDPMFLGKQLSEEERMIAQTAYDYCQSNLLPRVLDANRDEVFHREIMNELGELGLLGMTIEEEYGGSAMGYLAHVVAIEEIARGSGSTALRPVR